MYMHMYLVTYLLRWDSARCALGWSAKVVPAGCKRRYGRPVTR